MWETHIIEVNTLQQITKHNFFYMREVSWTAANNTGKSTSFKSASSRLDIIINQSTMTLTETKGSCQHPTLLLHNVKMPFSVIKQKKRRRARNLWVSWVGIHYDSYFLRLVTFLYRLYLTLSTSLFPNVIYWPQIEAMDGVSLTPDELVNNFAITWHSYISRKCILLKDIY